MVLESTASDVAIFIVQCFFAQTIYQVSGRNKWVAGLIVVLALLGFASGIALTGTTITTLYLAGKPLPLLNQLFVALALGMVTLTDIIITVSLIWYLYDGRSSSAGTTSHHLDGLILYCIQRGILTMVSHVLVVALWFALPTRWEWTLFQFSLGKVYTLTYLTLLNRRESMKDRYHEQSDLDVRLAVCPSDRSHRTEVATESAVESAA
ncbi:hypothetical protein JVU11DRAFT_7814 [Chiua virens]|nr:hypothetical protein JVU11DRAFT_7814 [Chiua virens]